ncbi:MAG: xanthine dehydrogenase family protein molybdopterin-binding subunit [Dehalococcoidia bacterium]|nr:xanthine dehydrogenase family protein molybdopterin-binding subunit [Dehalococcoidia bacterium]
MYEEYNIIDPFTKESYPQSIYHNQSTMKVLGDPSILRVDAKSKVAGELKFADDILLPNLVYLKFKRCPYSHARVTSLDVSKARALAGVVAVLTPSDVADLVTSPPYEYVLQEECWLEGNEVAAVVAEEEDIAEEALALIEVSYEQLPFTLYAEDALKPGAPILHGDTNAVAADWKLDRGDVATGFAQADKIVEDEYHSLTKPWTGARDHAGIESEALTAVFEGGNMVIYPSAQSPYSDAATIAGLLGMPQNKVRAVLGGSGVGFGQKGARSKGKILAAWVAKKYNRPCKCHLDTEGQFTTSGKMPDQHHYIKVGAKSDGTITALEGLAIGNSGPWGGLQTNDAHINFDKMFTTENISLVGRDAYTNCPPTSSLRCVHHPIPTMFIGIHMDRVAEEINMNPADFLVKNVRKTSGEGGDPTNPGWDIGKTPMPAMLEKVINDSGFKSKWQGWTKPMSVSGSKQRGIGVAVHCCRHGALVNPQAASLKANTDGTFSLICGSADVGQGARTVLALIAAEELGVPAANVWMAPLDTSTAQESRSPGGSTVTRGSGTAVIVACRDMKEQIFKLAIAANLINATQPEQLEMADNNVYLKSDPSVRVPVRNVTAQQSNVNGPLIARGSYATKRVNWMHRQWSADVAEVEVDADTGEYQVLNVWSESDIGRVGWYKGAMNQFYGGKTLFMGLNCFEGMVKDEATGITLNPDYLGYKIPTHADIPNYDLNFFENPDPYGPMGMKGVSEPQSPAIGPAIANAIYNAVGARVTDTPITPDKILKALGKA